jgi:hypothetical protein
MGLIFTPPLSIQEAVERGYDVYEVLFANWGVTDAPPSTIFTDMQFPQPGQPGIPASIAGIAIGPRSTVDRVWVSYNPLKKRNQNVVGQPNGLLRVCSVESPLMFAQAAGPPGVRNNPGAPNDPALTLSDKGQLYIFPMANSGFPGPEYSFSFPTQQETTVLPPTYIDVNGVSRPFGNFHPNPQASTYMTPFLHLYLFLKTPPIPLVYTKRAPLQVQGSIIIPPDDPGQEYVVAQVPTFGRKALKIGMRGTTGIWRVGALRGINQSNSLFEQPVDLSTDILAGTPVVLGSCNECCHYADYTNIYFTPTTNAGGLANFQLTAYD